ncbi:hypothetical protein A2U01_0059639, partial [Trifolium medium]|nr:hypothetical protein [Trifolium medium]
SRKKRNSLISDCDGELEIVSDGEKLFRDDGERFQVAVVVVVKDFDDAIP